MNAIEHLNNSYLIPFNLPSEIFERNFKRYALQKTLLPINFFAIAKIDIQGYYIPTYLFSGTIQSQYNAIKYTTIESVKKSGIFYPKLKNVKTALSTPFASFYYDKFSVLGPACKNNTIPAPLWNYINGYNIDTTSFKRHISICDTESIAKNYKFKAFNCNMDESVVWEDYTKQAVINNFVSYLNEKLKSQGLQNIHIFCDALYNQHSKTVFIPCWFAQIQYGKRMYSAFSIANVALGKILFNLPNSAFLPLFIQFWNIVSTLLIYIMPVIGIKLINTYYEVYYGYHPKNYIISAPWELWINWIIAIIVGIIIGIQIDRLIRFTAFKLKIYISRAMARLTQE